MYATIFFANQVDATSPTSYLADGINNVFPLPIAPTMFSVDVMVVIAQLDRSQENKFKLVKITPDNEKVTLLETSVPADEKDKEIFSTTFNGNLRNMMVEKYGEFTIKVYINNEEIGSTKLFFIEEPAYEED